MGFVLYLIELNLCVKFVSVPILQQLSLKHVLAHAGVDLKAALGLEAARSAAPHWVVAIPISRSGDSVEASAFYRSVTQNVDDDDKRANFAVMMNALQRAAQEQNYQQVLKGTTVSVKIAHKFKYANANHCVWELKQGKKDRVYFCSTTIQLQAADCPVIVPLMAFHKKDQNTPKEVIGYCEPTHKSYLAAGKNIQLIKERS